MWDLPGPGIESHVPCIGRLILNHCAIREALNFYIPQVSGEVDPVFLDLQKQVVMISGLVLRAMDDLVLMPFKDVYKFTDQKILCQTFGS